MKKTFRNALVGTLALTLLACAGTALTAVNASAEEADTGTVENTQATFSAPAFTMADGAAVRNVSTDKTKNGIRFTASMTSDAYLAAEGNADYDVKYGIAIIPKDYAETSGFGITAENLFGANAVYTSELTAKEAKEQNKRAMVVGESDELRAEGNAYVLKVAMVNILDSNLLREFIGTPYVAYKAKAETSYTYVLGNYYQDDVSNNTRSMTYVAQRAIEDGEDDDSDTLYTTYVQSVINAKKTAAYTVKRYFADGYGEYVYDEAYSETGEGAIGSEIGTEYTGSRYMGAYELNTEKSTKNPVVYANGKQVVKLYYDLKSDLEGSHIHGFGSELGTGGFYEKYVPANLTDGKTDTYFWSSSSPTKTSFITADLGQVQAVNTVTVTYGHETNNVYTSATVSYSTDGKTYTKLGSIGNDNQTQTLTFEQVSARYIRLACNDNDGQWVKIAEISASAIPTATAIEIDGSSRAKFAKGATTVDYSGLTYNLVYSDGSKTAADGSLVTITSEATLTPGKQTIGISYTDGDVTLEATQEIGVWYVIADSADWQLMNTYLDGYFMLESNLTLDGGNNDTIGVTPYVFNREFDITGAGQSPESITAEQFATLGEETVQNAVNYAKAGVPFTGKFDGQGYIVKGFKTSFSYDSTDTFLWGVGNYARTPFAYIGEGGYVGNFTLDAAVIESANDAAFIAGANFGTIENIVIAPNCTVFAQYGRASAVAAYNIGTIRNVVCHVTQDKNQTVTLTASLNNYGDSLIENCFIDNANHSDVLPRYTTENGLGWFYVEDCGMYFGNAAYKYGIGISSTELDINGAIKFYTAQTEPTTYGIYGYVWGAGIEYVFSTVEKNNGVYTLRLTDTAKSKLTVGTQYAFGFRLTDSATYYILIANITVTDCGATSVESGNLPNVYQGALENVIDGDASTYVWFGGASQLGSYLQLDLRKETTVSNIQFLMANDGSPDDRFQSVKIEYSTDGITWTEIGTYTDSEIYVVLETPVTARYLKASEATDHQITNWIIVREFAVNVATEA